MRPLIKQNCSGSLGTRSEEHTSELQSLRHLVCRLLLEKKKTKLEIYTPSTNTLSRQQLVTCNPALALARPATLDCVYLCWDVVFRVLFFFFFFNDTAPTEIYPLSLHDALPICFPTSTGTRPWLITLWAYRSNCLRRCSSSRARRGGRRTSSNSAIAARSFGPRLFTLALRIWNSCRSANGARNR